MAKGLFTAFSSLIGSGRSGDLPSSFNFTIGAQLPSAYDAHFKLFDGKCTTDRSKVTVFVYERKSGATGTAIGPSETPYPPGSGSSNNTAEDADPRWSCARNALKTITSIRHPNVLKPLGTADVPSGIYIATEAVRPLSARNLPQDPTWLLYQLGKTIDFFNVTAKLIHNQISPYAIYVTSDLSGYRLGAFEAVTPASVDAPPPNPLAPLLISRRICYPPGVLPYGRDVWGWLATAIYLYGELHNRKASLHSEISPAGDTLGPNLDFGVVPPGLLPICKGLLRGTTRARTPYSFTKLFRESNFFNNNASVQILSFLEEINLKSSFDKETFFQALPTSLDAVQSLELQVYQVLPLLPPQLHLNPSLAGKITVAIVQIALRSVGMLEVTGGDVRSDRARAIPNSPMVASPAAAYSMDTALTDAELAAVISERVVPTVLSLFSLPDRSVRYVLLNHFAVFDKHVSTAQAESVLDAVIQGCSDSAPLLREQSLKAFCVLVPKLHRRGALEKVQRAMARLQQDTEPGIRTNTVICFGKLAEAWPADLRVDYLFGAFAIGMRDPFVACRTASLNCVAACAGIFSDGEEVVRRLLPAVALLCADVDPATRSLAFATLDLVVDHARDLLDPARATGSASGMPAAADETVPASRQTTRLQSGEGSKNKGGWTQWALRRAFDFYGHQPSAEGAAGPGETGSLSMHVGELRRSPQPQDAAAATQSEAPVPIAPPPLTEEDGAWATLGDALPGQESFSQESGSRKHLGNGLDIGFDTEEEIFGQSDLLRLAGGNAQKIKPSAPVPGSRERLQVDSWTEERDDPYSDANDPLASIAPSAPLTPLAPPPAAAATATAMHSFSVRTEKRIDESNEPPLKPPPVFSEPNEKERFVLGSQQIAARRGKGGSDIWSTLQTPSTSAVSSKGKILLMPPKQKKRDLLLM